MTPLGSFNLIWRMESRSAEEIEAGYKGLAQALQLETEKLALHALIELVHSHLEDPRTGSWLLVYDDPKSEDAFFETIHALPRASPPHVGQILLTSRSPNWKNVKVVNIGGFTEEEAVGFGCRMLSHAQPAEVKTLCEQLGFHPLALCQAIGYLQKTKRSITAYLHAYKTSHHLRGSETATTLDGYGRTIESTVALSLEQFRSQRSASANIALTLIDHFALLAATPFPLIGLSETAKVPHSHSV